ncbi:NAD-specific glutamate dehydrogenase [compost metagenome]
MKNNWQALAREAFRDDLDGQQQAITVSLLQTPGSENLEARLHAWMEQRKVMVKRWRNMLAELRAATGSDYAMYAVASRELADLAQSGTAVTGT